MVLAHKQFDATDEQGNLLTGSVTVRVEFEAGGLGVPYGDRAGAVPLGNPFNNAGGKISFYAAAGNYKITVTQGAYSRVLRDVPMGLMQEADEDATKLPLDGSEPMIGPIGFSHQISPDDPPAGVLAVFAKADDKLYTRSSDGQERALAGGALANDEWLKGRNASDSADLNMFRVNSDDFTEWQNPLYYDDTGAFSDRQAKLTLQRNTGSLAPSTVVASIYSLVESKGDNASLKGASAGYFDSRDRSDVTGANKGVLHGITVNVGPRVDRNNTPYDDAAAVVIGNSGTARATEGLYIGHNVGGGGNDFLAAIGIDSHSSDAAIYITGSHPYGIDMARGPGATLTTAALRIPNNVNIVGRNAANNGNVSIAKVSAVDDSLQFRDGVLAVYPSFVLFGQPAVFPNAGVKVFDTNASHQLSFIPGSDLTAHRSLTFTTGDQNNTIDVPNLVAKNVANTFSAQQTISLSTSFAIPLIVSSTNADAVAGPLVLLDRNSASPAANDLGGAFYFYFRNLSAASVLGAGIGSVLVDPTAGSEDVRLTIDTVVNGAFATRLAVAAGVTIGSPTNGDMGLGTLNLDNPLYKDGLQVISDRRTGWAAATGTATRTTFATGTVTLPLLAERVKALIDDLISHGLIGA